jgi:hypothetical protein
MVDYNWDDVRGNRESALYKGANWGGVNRTALKRELAKK